MIGDDAAQAANYLARMLLLGGRSHGRTCSCAQIPTRCQVSAENDRVHVQFDPSQRCRVCGTPSPKADLPPDSCP